MTPGSIEVEAGLSSETVDGEEFVDRRLSERDQDGGNGRPCLDQGAFVVGRDGVGEDLVDGDRDRAIDRHLRAAAHGDYAPGRRRLVGWEIADSRPSPI